MQKENQKILSLNPFSEYLLNIPDPSLIASRENEKMRKAAISQAGSYNFPGNTINDTVKSTIIKTILF